MCPAGTRNHRGSPMTEKRPALLALCGMRVGEDNGPSAGTLGSGVAVRLWRLPGCPGMTPMSLFSIYFIFTESGGEEEREGETHPCVVASHAPPTGDPAHNPGICPDWESNQQPFGLQASPQSTEQQQPG